MKKSENQSAKYKKVKLSERIRKFFSGFVYQSKNIRSRTIRFGAAVDTKPEASEK